MASNMCFKGFICSPLYFSTASILKSLFWNSRANKRLNLSIEILFSANSVEFQGLQRISRDNIVFGHLSRLNSRAGTKSLHGTWVVCRGNAQQGKGQCMMTAICKGEPASLFLIAPWNGEPWGSSCCSGVWRGVGTLKVKVRVSLQTWKYLWQKNMAP